MCVLKRESGAFKSLRGTRRHTLGADSDGMQQKALALLRAAITDRQRVFGVFPVFCTVPTILPDICEKAFRQTDGNTQRLTLKYSGNV